MKTKIKEHLEHFNIAGFTYYDGTEVFHELKIGTKLELELDPDNKYDARAVKILYKGCHLGYIPRSCNRIFYKLLKVGGTNIETRVQRICSEDNPEEQIGVVAHLVG